MSNEWEKLKEIIITRKITRESMDKFLKKHATKTKTLDVGCGNSRYSRYFPNNVGFDIMKSRNVDVVGDVHSLSFKNDSFDVVLATEVLEHLIEPQQAINEMKRVLKDRGKLILTTRFIFPLHDTPHDYYRYTKYGLKYLLREWEITEMEEETDTIECIAVLIQRIAFQCNILYFKPFKPIFHLAAHFIKHFGFIITKEYGVVHKNIPEKNIMTSGYYVVAIKINGDAHTNKKNN